MRDAAIRLNHLQTVQAHAFLGEPLLNSKSWDTGPTLGDVSDIVSGVTKGRKLNGAATRNVPYLAVANVQDGALRLDAVKVIEATEDEITRLSLTSEDLLLTEGGDPDKLGRGALWKNELPSAYTKITFSAFGCETEASYQSIYIGWSQARAENDTF